jgi:NAD(P)H dehydrogenase (quinone)
MSVIVTGAAGHLGRLVAEQLLERIAPEQVILVTRRPQALRGFRARGATVRYGDFDDPASLPGAFAGGNRMLLISTDAVGRRIWQHRAAIKAAAGAGVGHVVFTSIVNPVARNPLGANAWEQGETELMLQRSGLAWTVLRFGSFAELQLPRVATAVQNRQMLGNAGDGRIAPVSRRDCAEAAAITLTTNDHTCKTYQITGPEALSKSELAELYAELTGRPVKIVHLSDMMLTAVLIGIGTPVPIAWRITAFGRAVRYGYFDVVDSAFERLAGRPPVRLRDVLIAQRADLLSVARAQSGSSEVTESAIGAGARGSSLSRGGKLAAAAFAARSFVSIHASASYSTDACAGTHCYGGEISRQFTPVSGDSGP